MSINSIIYTVLICLAFILLTIAIFVFNRRNRSDDSSSWKNDNNDQIYVGNLSYHLMENDLHQYFSRFGVIEAIKIIRNFRTGRSKGYAFVTYISSKQAIRALDAHGKDLQGRSLVVRIAKSREQQHAYT